MTALLSSTTTPLHHYEGLNSVNADSTVDMLLDYCKAHPEGIVLKLAGPQHLPAVAAHPEPLGALV